MEVEWPDLARRPLDDELEAMGAAVVEAAFRVHRAWGPGLLERVYARGMVHLLEAAGLQVEREAFLPISLEGHTIDGGLRLDLLVEGRVVVEIKAVEQLLPVHHAQLVTYLRLSGAPLGYLVNFHVPLLKHGLKRFVNTQGN